MRTKKQIQTNISKIDSAMAIIKDQLELLEKDYQANAIEQMGEPCDSFTQIQEALKNGWNALNSLLHMEIDLKVDYDYIIKGIDPDSL